MLGQWGHMGFLVVVGIALPAVALIVSFLLGLLRIRPQDPNAVKADTYECGIPTEGPSWIQFHAGYYVFALLFVVFDIETVFLYPWAVALRQQKLFAFLDALLFIAILAVGYVYAWRKRAFEWR
jgi:NADH-quinone oxidoreductase subunit A